jgi:DNA processing protein
VSPEAAIAPTDAEPSDGVRARPPSGFPEGFVDDRDAILLLRCVLGTTPRTMHELAWRHDTASACLDAFLRGRAGSQGDRDFLDSADPEAIRRRLDAAGARFVIPGDPEFAPMFLHLPDPPIGVFVRGRPLFPAPVRVAVVGSRRSTALGRDVAMDLGRGLASAGVEVVSGAAVGIDGAAHRSCLDAGGRTVAVLGSGIDVAYPAANRELLRRVVAAGSIVSEYPPGTPAEPFRFPARNRLIAALCRAVVVVEGGGRSGTRITADHALDLGIEVFAVPGPVTSPLAETPLALIREGATLIRGVDDVLRDLDVRPGGDAAGAPPELPPDERRVFDQLAAPSLPDAVARACGTSIPDAVSALIALELKGLARCVGGRYERTFVALEDRGPGG